MVKESVEEYPVLIAQSGPLKGQRWVVDRPLLIGREATCDVVIPDRQVSRFHARLIPSPQGVVLEDLDSKNGTHRNGNPVEKQVTLEDGDMLQIALAQQFIYLTSDATMPLPEANLRTGRLRLDVRGRVVWVGQRQIDPPLSALQFRVLQVLVERQGQVIDRQQLIEAAWGEEQAAGVSDQALDALLRRLRDRIAALDPSHAYIVTVRGHGVRFDNPPLN